MPVIPLHADSRWSYSSVQSERTHSSFFAPEFAIEPSGAKENVVKLSVASTDTNKCVQGALLEERFKEKEIRR